MIPIVETIKRHTLNILAYDSGTLSYRWQKKRNLYLKTHGKWCRICGYTKKIEVHHIIPRHVNSTLALATFNLVALCDDCHFHVGHFNNYKLYNPDIRELIAFIDIKNKMPFMKNKIYH